MPLSNSVIRRYTPPTCTLEVKAQNSPLSQWMGKTVLKQLRFELRLDDPRLPEEQRIAIRGDRDQLEALCATVTKYVQEFLQKSPDKFWESYSEEADSHRSLNGNDVQDSNNLSSRTTTLGRPFNTQIPRNDIYIEPSSHLSHNLFLGSIASQIPGGVVKLSLLQLFDLASALDEYSADVMALPNLESGRQRSFGVPAWAPVAAVVALAVGLTPITMQYANRNRQQTAKQDASQPETIALQTPASESLLTPQPGLSPQDSLPTLGGLPSVPPGATNQGIPIPGITTTPGAVTVPGAVPPPPISGTIPTPGVVPNAKLPANAPGVATSQLPPNLNIPSGVQSNPNYTFPKTAPLPTTGNTFTIPGTGNPRLPTTVTGRTSPTTPPPLPSIALQPNLGVSRPSPIPKAGTNTPGRGNIASSRLPATSSAPATLPPGLSPLPPLGGGDTQSLARNNKPSQTAPRATGDETSQLISRLRDARSGPQASNASNTNRTAATNSTIFDTPQVSEARDALRKNWQPPAGLKQTLEYSLLVGVDGSIERIMPLGRAARDYIDRTGMPLIGERFVSPNRNGQAVRIRAVFSPDGKVQAFPEND